MIEFRMPSLGADMDAGTLVEWLKQPGDAVARGDIIAVVDTDKGAIEIEVFDTGVVDRVLVQPGERTPVGTVLALIRAPGEAPGAGIVPSAGVGPPVLPPSLPVPAMPAAPQPPPSRRRVTPAARKAAGQLKIDLESV